MDNEKSKKKWKKPELTGFGDVTLLTQELGKTGGSGDEYKVPLTPWHSCNC
jgi:hypothetical protein